MDFSSVDCTDMETLSLEFSEVMWHNFKAKPLDIDSLYLSKEVFPVEISTFTYKNILYVKVEISNGKTSFERYRINVKKLCPKR